MPKIDYEERFIEMLIEERMELDRFANVRPEYSKDLFTWSSEDLYFGLVGGGEDIGNAIEMLIESETAEEVESGVKEYNACQKTYKRYVSEITRRIKALDKEKGDK